MMMKTLLKPAIIITLSALIIVAVLIIGGVLYLQNQPKTTNIAKTKDNSSSYHIGKGAEVYADIAKSAVEAYATQNISEPKADRNLRLSAHFAADSPVFSRDIEIRSSNTALKTIAKVNSVNLPLDGDDLTYVVTKADVTSYYGSDKNTKSLTFWVTFEKKTNGSYFAYNIGLSEGQL